MNIYITAPHRRPFLFGTTDADIEAAKALGLDVDLLIHPGGKSEWAICLERHDDPALLPDWRPVSAEAGQALIGSSPDAYPPSTEVVLP